MEVKGNYLELSAVEYDEYKHARRAAEIERRLKSYDAYCVNAAANLSVDAELQALKFEEGD